MTFNLPKGSGRVKRTIVNKVSPSSKKRSMIASMALVHSDLDLQYFPKNYDVARAWFRNFASSFKSEGGHHQSFKVPSRVDSDLSVDSLYLPAQRERRRLLLLTSGIHGVEAPAGSAIQRMFASEILPNVSRDSTGILMVHCLNPYGWKYGRRSTENNVNLNRNFFVGAENFDMMNHGYQRLAPLGLELKSKVASVPLQIAKTAGFLARSILLQRMKAHAVTGAVAQGQFHSPRGLEYGGCEPEPQSQHFMELVRETAPGYRDIVLFDLHTGLGERFDLHLISTDRQESVNSELMNIVLKPAEDRDIYLPTTGDDEGFYKTYGDLNSVIPDLVDKDARVLALTVEYGTLGASMAARIDLLSRIIAENQGHHFGYVSEEVERSTKLRFKESFDPEELKWQTMVLARARTLLSRAVDRLSKS